MTDEAERYHDQEQKSGAPKFHPVRSQAATKPYQQLGSSSQQGIFNRVADYVPAWLTSWFSSSSRQNEALEPESDLGGSQSNGPSDRNLECPLPEEADTLQGSVTPQLLVAAPRTLGLTDISDRSSGIKRRKLSSASAVGDIEHSLVAYKKSDEREVRVYPYRDNGFRPPPEAGFTTGVLQKLRLPHADPFEPFSKPAFKVSAFVSSPPVAPSLSRPVFKPVPEACLLSVSSRSALCAGETDFGGVSFRERDSKRRKFSPVSRRLCTTRAHTRAKPLLETPRSVVASETARKILSSLEEMATPLGDGFQRPSVLEPMRSMTDRLRRNSVVKEESLSRPPAKNLRSALSTPAFFYSASSSRPNVSTLASSLESVNCTSSLSNASQTFLGTPSVRPSDSAACRPRGLEVSVSSEVLKDCGRAESIVGKIRREKRTSHTCEENLVNTWSNSVAPAALLMAALPKFDFAVSQASKSVPVESPSLGLSKASQSEIRFIGTSTPFGLSRTQPMTVDRKASVGVEGFRFARPGVMFDTTLSDTPNLNSIRFQSPFVLAPGSVNNCVRGDTFCMFGPEVKSPQGVCAESSGRTLGMQLHSK